MDTKSSRAPAAVLSFKSAATIGEQGYIPRYFINFLKEKSSVEGFVRTYQTQTTAFADFIDQVAGDTRYYMLPLSNLWQGIQGHDDLCDIMKAAYVKFLPRIRSEVDDAVEQEISLRDIKLDDEVVSKESHIKAERNKAWESFLQNCNKFGFSLVAQVSEELWPKPIADHCPDITIPSGQEQEVTPRSFMRLEPV